MHILISLFLWSFMVLSPLTAQEKILRDFSLKEVYAPESSDIHDIIEIPETEWHSPIESHFYEPEKDHWIKASLDSVYFEKNSYLTEHQGVRSWELFLVKEDSLVKSTQVDWAFPYWNNNYRMVQYRGFTYAQIHQLPGEHCFVYIRIRNKYSSPYKFILRSFENFSRKQHAWALIQGLGLGFLFVILLLSFILIVNMKHRINWLYLILVIFSSFNILLISGLGTYFAVLIKPHGGLRLWYTLIGLFNPAIILYIKSLLKLSAERKPIRVYFRFLLYFSLLSSFIPLFVSSYSSYFYVNLVSTISFLLIGAGLIWLTMKKIKAAQWLLIGWFIYFFINSLGIILSQLIEIRVLAPVICYLLAEGFLVMFFGAAMILDIDDRRKKETDLRISAETTAHDAVTRMSESERMADLGRLVASVTHELGTPLGVGVTLSTSIVSSSKRISELFKKDELSEEDFKEYVSDTMESSELIYRNMEQARSLVNSFKEVASDQVVPDIRTINLKNYLEMLIKGLLPGIRKSGNRIELSLSDDLVITSIPGILSQVLTNLINNALIHGLGGTTGGVITLKGHKNKNSIILSVADTGKGIPSDIQDKIFDVYFTTRKGSGGTGLGLFIVKSLVEDKLKGTISFESFPGSGTEFTVILPESITES